MPGDRNSPMETMMFAQSANGEAVSDDDYDPAPDGFYSTPPYATDIDDIHPVLLKAASDRPSQNLEFYTAVAYEIPSAWQAGCFEAVVDKVAKEACGSYRFTWHDDERSIDYATVPVWFQCDGDADDAIEAIYGHLHRAGFIKWFQTGEGRDGSNFLRAAD